MIVRSSVIRETIAKSTTSFYGVSCVFHARFHARSGKNTGRKCGPLGPFVLNDLVLSLLSLKSPFCPVLCPFCPVLCPFCPSHKRLKCAGTVYDTKFIGNFEGLSGIKGRKGTF